jgi:hypothetical protein
VKYLFHANVSEVLRCLDCPRAGINFQSNYNWKAIASNLQKGVY